jgi:hypothetical protein
VKRGSDTISSSLHILAHRLTAPGELLLAYRQPRRVLLIIIVCFCTYTDSCKRFSALFHCSRSKKCVLLNDRCDSHIHCPDGEDEEECGQQQRYDNTIN